MKATFKDARLFRNIVGALSSFLEEADITASTEGLKLRAMDLAHIAMVDFACTKKMFETYDCPKDQVFRINLGKLSKLLGRANPGEALELFYDEESAKLKFILTGASTKRFSVSTMPPEYQKTPNPNAGTGAKVLITSKSFAELLGDSNAVAKEVLLTVTADKLVAEAKDMDSVVVEKPIAAEVMEINVQAQGSVSAKYDIEYLSNIVGPGSSVSDLSTIEFSTDRPIKVSFMLPEGKLDYYLAPKVGKAE